MSEYWKKLQDPRWQRKRLEILNRADFTCEHCSAKTETLHVHHNIYHKGRNPWEYDGKELSCLCDSCHENWHGIKDLINRVLVDQTQTEMRGMLAYGIASILDSGAARRAQIGSRSAVTAFARYFGVSNAAIEGIIDEDNWIEISDIRLLQAPKKTSKKRVK
jgi:hypothetical protein